MKRKPKLRKPVVHDAPTAPAPVASEGKPLVFRVNIAIPPGIAGPIGRFLQAGAKSPFHSIDEVPINLRGFVVQSSDEAELEPDDDQLPSATFVLGEQYAVGRDGLRRSRKLQREVNLQLAQQEQQEYWEQALSEPSESERVALELVQRNHETLVARDTAIATARARECDLSTEYAREFTEEDQIDADSVSPTIQEQNT